jgi:hypothetical protein
VLACLIAVFFVIRQLSSSNIKIVQLVRIHHMLGALTLPLNFSPCSTGRGHTTTAGRHAHVRELTNAMQHSSTALVPFSSRFCQARDLPLLPVNIIPDAMLCCDNAARLPFIIVVLLQSCDRLRSLSLLPSGLDGIFMDAITVRGMLSRNRPLRCSSM